MKLSVPITLSVIAALTLPAHAQTIDASTISAVGRNLAEQRITARPTPPPIVRPSHALDLPTSALDDPTAPGRPDFTAYRSSLGDEFRTHARARAFVLGIPDPRDQLTVLEAYKNIEQLRQAQFMAAELALPRPASIAISTANDVLTRAHGLQIKHREDLLRHSSKQADFAYRNRQLGWTGHGTVTRSTWSRNLDLRDFWKGSTKITTHTYQRGRVRTVTPGKL